MTSVQEDFLDFQFELLKGILAPDELKRYLRTLKQNPPPGPNEPPISDDDFETWATKKFETWATENRHREIAAFMAGQPPS